MFNWKFYDLQNLPYSRCKEELNQSATKPGINNGEPEQTKEKPKSDEEQIKQVREETSFISLICWSRPPIMSYVESGTFSTFIRLTKGSTLLGKTRWRT